MIENEPGEIAMSSCYTCREPFGFNPETVPSVYVNPATGQVLEEHEDKRTGVKQPICPACVRVINAARQNRGLAPHWQRAQP